MGSSSPAWPGGPGIAGPGREECQGWGNVHPAGISSDWQEEFPSRIPAGGRFGALRAYDDESDVNSEAAESSGSELCTDHLSESEFSECNMADVEVSSDYEADAPILPLLDVKAGLQPPAARRRVPPASWLSAAGFGVSDDRPHFASSPYEMVNAERPPYLNLFCRQFLAQSREGLLTEARLDRHDCGMGRVRHCDRQGAGACETAAAEQNAKWLQAFVTRARAAPLNDVTSSMLADGVGTHVASFLDELSDGSSVGAEIDDEDTPDGVLMRSHRLVHKGTLYGPGRPGFYVDADALVSTPGRSPSPPPRR